MRTFSKRTLAAPAALAALGLVLTGCGSKATDTASGDSTATSCVDTSGDTIKVGSLNSLSGTMAISEVTVRDSISLAVQEINDSGGVLGKKIQIVAE
ncbi:MAG: transporter substrate-binding protein, partial [Rhodococcus sp. (in: high G+C Gram-positive bacteria)]